MTRISRRLMGLSLLVASAVLPLGAVSAQDATAVRIGTSGLGSPYYIIGVGMGEMLKKHANINAAVETFGGSVATMFGMAQKKIELGMITSYTALLGYQGRPPFGDPTNVSLVLQGQPTYRILVVRRGANINGPEDLRGKRIVGRRPALVDLELVTKAFLDAYGIPLDSVNIISTTTTGETYNALRTGTVDAAFLPASQRTASLHSAYNDGAIRFFPTTEEKAREVLAQLPEAFFVDAWPAKLFDGQKNDILAWGLRSYLLARNDLSDDLIYKVAKSLMDNQKELASYHAQGKRWTVEQTLRNPVLPYHPGAARYFREIGKWTPELEAFQEKATR